MPPYNPVTDFLKQRGTGHGRPTAEERRLLSTLSKSEVDALVSILNKVNCGRKQPIAYMHGPSSF